MQYGGVGRRLVAVIIDGVIYVVLAWLVALLTGGTSSGGFELNGAPALLSFLLWVVYYVAMETMVGATLGKLVMGLRVVQFDGAPLTLQAAVIRNVLRIIDGLFFYLVGAVLVWTSPTRQRLGDRVAHTVVIRRAA